MIKIGSKCRACKYLYTSYGKSTGCYYDLKKLKTLSRKSCPNFKKGFSFVPRVNGKLAKIIQIDPTKHSAYAFYTKPEQTLLLTWHVGHDEVGYWKIRLIGILPDGGIAPKQFSTDDLRPAFYGEVSITGPDNSDIYTSSGYEDPDEKDEEGNIVNKPCEIKIYPVRERKVHKTRKK